MAFTLLAKPAYAPAQGADAANQGASISSANIFGVPSNGAGKYRVSVYINTHTTGGSGTVTCTIGWNDGVATQSQLVPASGSLSLAANGFVQAAIEIYCAASTNITALTTWSTAGSYDIHIRVEYLG